MTIANQRYVERQRAARDGKVVRAAAAAAIAFVCGVIFYGYMNFVAAAKPAWPSAFPYLAGIVAAAFAFLFANATARERFGAARSQAKADPYAGMGWFAGLLIVSAMGLMNSLFLVLEGDDVVASRLESARKTFVQLEQEGKKALQIPAIEDERNKIKLALNNLRQRIVDGRDPGNPNSNACGIGPDAEAEFQALQKHLPQFGRLPLTNVHQCAQQTQLVRLYAEHEKVAWEQFESRPEYRSNQGKKRDTIVKDLPEFVSRAHNQLQLRAAGETNSLASVRERLSIAAKSYADKKAEIEAVVGGELTALPPRLDIDDVANIGNPGHAVKLLLQRLNHLLTWLIIGVAFFFDWALVRAFAKWWEHDLGEGSVRQVTPNQSSNTEVRYLWDEQTG